MSEIVSSIVVEQTNINFSPNNNNINVTPEAIQLNIFTNGGSPSAGNITNGQLVYSNSGIFAGVTTSNFANGVLSLGGTANVNITGGSSGYYLQTNGAGGLTWAAGTGNVTGNASAAGANNQIQLSTGTGNFKAGAGFSFDTASNILSASGNGDFAGNVSANYFLGNGSLLTGIAVYSNLIFDGNSNVKVYSDGNVGITIDNNANIVLVSNGQMTVNSNIVTGGITGNISGVNYVNSNYFVGDGSMLTGITSSGNATTAGTVTTNAQPNITSVGTLTSLNVSGNITAANITANTGKFTGNGSGLTAITGANVTGTVANATYSVSAGSATTATTAGSATTAGTVTTAAQPNITSVGTLTSLTVTGNLKTNANNIALGNSAGSSAQGANAVAIGYLAGQTSQGQTTVAVGFAAGQTSQGQGAVAIGTGAGQYNGQGPYAVAIGASAGLDNQGDATVAIGVNAGQTNQGINAIAIGQLAGNANQAVNSIVMNATGVALENTTANTFVVKPIRDVTAVSGFTVQLYYNPTTGEIGYK